MADSNRMSVTEFNKLSKEEQLLEIAKANIERYRSLTPPPEVVLQTLNATCPKCGHEGPVAKDFGTKRGADGKVRAQSWCRSCRNSKNSHPSRFGLQGTAKKDPLSADERKMLELLQKKLGGTK